MEIKGEAKLLRIFISNTDTFRLTPLYETIVYAAKRYGLAGATVLRGVMGFGSSSRIHSAKYWELVDKLPMVVEIVDESEKIEKFVERILPWFDKISYGCMITVEKANIVLYKQGSKKNFIHQ
jgi:PII-like signaling protein